MWHIQVLPKTRVIGNRFMAYLDTPTSASTRGLKCLNGSVLVAYVSVFIFAEQFDRQH